jgi:hypothetical protein
MVRVHILILEHPRWRTLSITPTLCRERCFIKLTLAIFYHQHRRTKPRHINISDSPAFTKFRPGFVGNYIETRCPTTITQLSYSKLALCSTLTLPSPFNASFLHISPFSGPHTCALAPISISPNTPRCKIHLHHNTNHKHGTKASPTTRRPPKPRRLAMLRLLVFPPLASVPFPNPSQATGPAKGGAAPTAATVYVVAVFITLAEMKMTNTIRMEATGREHLDGGTGEAGMGI